MVDTTDLKSVASACRFESGCPYQDKALTVLPCLSKNCNPIHWNSAEVPIGRSVTLVSTAVKLVGG